MGSTTQNEKVQCKTIDGHVLHGLLYPAHERAPMIIMTHGMNVTKEILLPETAEYFQAQGFNALLYDPRTIGESEGTPRNDIDPLRQAEDLSDVVTYATTLPTVNANQILLWGLSFGGTVSACTTVVDRRVKGLIMVAPIFDFVQPEKRKSAFPLIMKDRQSQVKGNQPPFDIPPYDSNGENIIGMGGSGGPGGIEGYTLMQQAMERQAPNFRDKITLQSYYRLALFKPRELLDLIEEVPTLMIVPENDDISTPDEQKAGFERIQSPKKLHVAKEERHLTVLSGKGAQEVLEVTMNFVEGVLKGQSEP